MEPIDYIAAGGWNGEVIDGHSSHPECGERIHIDIAYRPVRTREEATR